MTGDWGDMLERAATIGVLVVFLGVWLFGDFSTPTAGVTTVVRWYYAAVMTVAPTSQLAIAIDIGAAMLALVVAFRSLERDVRVAIFSSAVVYFTISAIANYLTAPI